jgi:protein translocase SecG subunit
VHYVVILLGTIQVAFAVALIFIIDGQQTKNEGLGGTIGGRVQSSFKGKPGFEERLSEMTRMLGIGFFATSLLVAILSNR